MSSVYIRDSPCNHIILRVSSVVIRDRPCENIIMAGDTITDICFAKNAGIFSVCVGKNELARQYADAAIPDVSHIFEVIKGDF